MSVTAINSRRRLEPTWLGLLPGYIAILEDRDMPVKTRQMIREEFKRMAQAADAYNIIAAKGV